MKNILFLFILGLSMTCYSQEFAPVNAKWHFQNYYLGFHEPITYSVIKSVRDTVIDEKYSTIIHLYDNNGVDFVTDLIVHEDQGIVYFFEHGEFKLFFDYNLDVGDTLAYRVPLNAPLFQSNGGGDEVGLNRTYYALITEKETVEIDGKAISKFHTSIIRPIDLVGSYTFWDLGIFTQRIGSPQGLFGKSEMELLGGFPGYYRCYEDHEISINMSPYACDFTTVNIIEFDKNALILTYPNPVQEFLKIKLLTENCSRIELIDPHGKVVKTQQLEGQNVLELNLSGLPSGLYILTMECNGFSRQYAKIIKK